MHNRSRKLMKERAKQLRTLLASLVPRAALEAELDPWGECPSSRLVCLLLLLLLCDCAGVLQHVGEL